jgi:hypothetical protein
MGFVLLYVLGRERGGTERKGKGGCKQEGEKGQEIEGRRNMRKK